MNLKFILFIPIIEIFLFVLLGDFLGFFLVVILIFLTGLIGLFLLRSNVNIEELKKLTSEPNEWLYKKISGILLIIPGFFTDILALVMLVKSLRGIVWRFLISQKPGRNKRKRDDNEKIIEADYRDLDED